jgi:asparaginyl-tRNA synthetase
VKFEKKVFWGVDLASEHEKYLTDKIFEGPIILYNYPKDIKSFYMKINEDGKTVQAMDVLVPRIGEVMGGSAREDDLEQLDRRIEGCKLDK